MRDGGAAVVERRQPPSAGWRVSGDAYKRTLVPVDRSPPAKLGLEEAVRLAKALHAAGEAVPDGADKAARRAGVDVHASLFGMPSNPEPIRDPPRLRKLRIQMLTR